MTLYICEACVELKQASLIIDLASDNLRRHGVSSSREEGSYMFDFRLARVLISSEPDILWLRVEADELAACDGTKVLVEAELRGHARDMPTHVLWLKANSEPFSTIMFYKASGGVTAC